MSTHWSADDVWDLLPDGSSRSDVLTAADGGSWPVLGAAREVWGSGTGQDGSGPGTTVWGEHARDASAPLRVAVRLPDAGGGPLHRCGCPVRRRMCAHALALLLLWIRGRADDTPPPDWVVRWPGRRAAALRAVEQRALRRADRVAAGLADLELWLRDQVDTGLADARTAGYAHWDGMAARLVDAQAGRVARRVRALAGAVGSAGPPTSPDWPSRLLAEAALLRLLASGYRRRDRLPEGLRATVLSRVGLGPGPESAPVRDSWQVLGRHDFSSGRLAGCRTWLRGEVSGRIGLVLAFAPEGGAPDAPLPPATVADAEVVFRAAEHRASVSRVHGERPLAAPSGGGAGDAMRSWAGALAEDPWLEAWPVVLEGVRPARDASGSWCLADADGAALPVCPQAAPPWRLLAVSGGAPVTVAAEWTPEGVRPLTVWPPGDDRGVPCSGPVRHVQEEPQ
ncbi:SWIM zinc finger family protein [Nocardiopsis sp. RSe5-2]|uniref:SWIM zinc finger family protein n=1 Tax=Nocardiopsis endophytica TaxID=3018445 RepID=A0ABT4U707_9ACTN|nr:SWIM zinc finger family protein [Nocardiopsis endophytica]MDA2812725.1 SWIM zinc finger family protein [Nocardiopsis endophytica]